MLNTFPNGIDSSVVSLHRVIDYNSTFAIDIGFFRQACIGANTDRHNHQVCGYFQSSLKTDTPYFFFTKKRLGRGLH